MEHSIVPLVSGRRRLTPAERVKAFQDAAAQICELTISAEQTRDAAIGAIHRALNTRLAVGLKLIEIKTAFAGNFDEWLEGYCAEWFSRKTAYRWIAKVNDLKIALGNPDPTFKQLCDAQRAADTLPEPFSTDGEPSSHPAPIFRIAFSVNETPPEQWGPVKRREFIEKAKPIAELYARVLAAQSA